MSYITMGGLNHPQVGPFSGIPEYKIVLSWDLLVWISVKDRIPCSFTNYITTPELSGTLFINPDIYHTQITEYSLKTILLNICFQWALFSSASNILLTFIPSEPLVFNNTLSIRTGALGDTFPVLFRLKRFLIYSDQFLQNTLNVITPQNRCLIPWRLLLSGFRSVLVNAT